VLHRFRKPLIWLAGICLSGRGCVAISPWPDHNCKRRTLLYVVSVAHRENLPGTIAGLPRSGTRATFGKRWHWFTLAIVALVALTFLFAASQQRSPWRVSIDLTNWRIYSSEAIEFHQGGLEVHSTKKHFIGPVVISSERTWKADQARPVIDSAF
jgi:hypothetical protein